MTTNKTIKRYQVYVFFTTQLLCATMPLSAISRLPLQPNEFQNLGQRGNARLLGADLLIEQLQRMPLDQGLEALADSNENARALIEEELVLNYAIRRLQESIPEDYLAQHRIDQQARQEQLQRTQQLQRARDPRCGCLQRIIEKFGNYFFSKAE